VTSLDPANYTYHVSADGRVVIGSNRSTRAIRWTQEDGWTAIGHPELYAGALSADGSTIVGLDGSGSVSEAFFWNPSSGVVNLQDYLLANGVVEVEEWTLKSAIDVSADGRTILGAGTNPLGQTEAWVVTIPEPPTVLLLAAALFAIAAMRIRCRRTVRHFVFAIMIGGAPEARTVVAQYSFTPAGKLPSGGFQGNPTAISADGTTVVGSTDSPNGTEAFRYSVDTGMALLGDLPGGRFESRAHAVSHDGSIVLGTSSFQTVYGTGSAPVLQPFQWSPEHGMVGIGFAADAAATTTDGSVMVGSTNSGVFRWSATQGPVYVLLPSINSFPGASDASADGNTIVGLSRNLSGHFEAFRWTADGGVSLLGPGSYASDVSGDGRVIIGWHGSAGGSRWTEQTGWTPLGHPQTDAHGINADGSVIVGSDRAMGKYDAFFWTQSTGIVNLRESLLAGGVDEVRGWNLLAAIDVSADGRTIVGVGDSPLGRREGWVATIPEPSGIVLAALALASLVSWRVCSHAKTRRAFALLSGLFIIAPAETAHAQFSFTRLGDLPGGTVLSSAQGVSSDGSIVVGHSFSAQGYEAFRWTSEEGMIGLGFLGSLADMKPFSFAEAISADGSVIVGRSTSSTSVGEAFRWTRSEGMVGLGHLASQADGTLYSNAYDVSADGRVVVGTSTSPNGSRQAFRWTQADGMVELGDLPRDGLSSGASAVSGDGKVIGGAVRYANGDEAFRWTAAEGIIGIGDLSGGDSRSFVSSASKDGSLLAGMTTTQGGAAPFRWTTSEGMISLADPQVLEDGTAWSMTPDGATIVGGGMDPATNRNAAYFWTQGSGWVKLQDYLVSHGVTDFGGVTMFSATGISADGRTIIGSGVNAQGQGEAWVATIAEPSTFILFTAATIAMAAARNRLRKVIRHCFLIAVALSAATAVRPVAAQYSFTPASELPGGGFRGNAAAMSGDGSTVVGWTEWPEPQQAWRWNAETGMVLLGVLHDTDGASRARGVSFDGSVVVGDSIGRVFPGQTSGLTAEAFRWSAEGGMVGLGLLPGANLSTAEVCSADGSVIAGLSGWYSVYSSLKAFRWTAEEGIVELDRSPGSTSGVSGISSDGNVIAGWIPGSSRNAQPVLWTSEGRVDVLGSSSIPDGVSADGQVVIGWLNGAARWTEQTGWVSLGDPTADAYAVNGDGSVIVGHYNSPDGALFFWTPTTGIVNLRRHLLDQGLTQLQGWTLEEATDISDDGRTILGYGTNPRGETEAWIATIPEPPTCILAALAVGALVLLSRRVRRCQPTGCSISANLQQSLTFEQSLHGIETEDS
jgi:probable HAF family extracellular repeat protein